MNILYIDIEGGWGGSSRSLYYLIKHLDRGRFNTFVLLGKPGPAEELYQRLDIPLKVFSPIPRTTALKRNNLPAFARFLLQLVDLPRLVMLLKQLIRRNRIDCIHLNHESLFVLAAICKYYFKIKVICHVRTMLPDNRLGRMQVRITAKASDHLIFITENERNRWQKLYPDSLSTPHTVVYNIAVPCIPKYTNRSENKKFKVISLMTLSYDRGVDRLVDVALSLKKIGERDIAFVVCGRDASPQFLEQIKRRVEQEALEERFVFLGHQLDPEIILAHCDVLIRLSRENNPWGRDIIEAVMHGKPVVATGSYEGFVENGINGFLLPEFDADEVARRLIYLKEHPEVLASMGQENQARGLQLFEAYRQTHRVEDIYESLRQPETRPRGRALPRESIAEATVSP